MKRALIIKKGAAGDVMRTTTLLNLLSSEWLVDWIISSNCKELLPSHKLHAIYTDADHLPRTSFYDLVISLEDDLKTLEQIFCRIKYTELFGTRPDHGSVVYTDSSHEWFDMGLVSVKGREAADELKKHNRKTYQQILFKGLGYEFANHPYVLPHAIHDTNLRGDIAIATKSGERWPSKSWAYYDKLIDILSNKYVVNVLPWRFTLNQHMADIRQHRLLISGDSLPMHIAIGLGVPLITLFTCTSPWEIADYGIQTKIVSPLLEQYFYTREYIPELVKSISVDEVLEKVNL